MLKVKIGNKIYSSAEEPIMIICTHEDRQQIGSMPPEMTKYAQAPAHMSSDDLKEWMKKDECKNPLCHNGIKKIGDIPQGYCPDCYEEEVADKEWDEPTI